MEQSELKYFEHCISSSHDTLVSIVKQTGVEKLKIIAYQLFLAIVSLYLALFSISEDRTDVLEGVFLGSSFFPFFLQVSLQMTHESVSFLRTTAELVRDL